jgi:hypothetical protein
LGRLGEVAHNRGYPIRQQGYRLEIHPRVRIRLGMDSDRIRTDTNPDVTIYHIVFRIRIRILSNTNAKRIFRIRIRI